MTIFFFSYCFCLLGNAQLCDCYMRKPGPSNKILKRHCRYIVGSLKNHQYPPPPPPSQCYPSKSPHNQFPIYPPILTSGSFWAVASVPIQFVDTQSLVHTGVTCTVIAYVSTVITLVSRVTHTLVCRQLIPAVTMVTVHPITMINYHLTVLAIKS